MSRTRPACLAVATIALVLAACGTDGDDDAGGTDAPAGDATGEPASDTADAVTVTAVDFAFEGVPASAPAGTSFALRNDATTELHEIVAFRLPDDETRSIDELLELPEEEAGALLGEPATVIIAPPQEDGFPVVGDGTLTEPGRYVFICAIPVGADPQAYLDAAEEGDGPPDIGGGPPHFVEGMVAELEIE